MFSFVLRSGFFAFADFCWALPGFKALPNLEVEKSASECFPTRRYSGLEAPKWPRQGQPPERGLCQSASSGFVGSRVLLGFAGWQNPVKIFVLKVVHRSPLARVMVGFGIFAGSRVLLGFDGF